MVWVHVVLATVTWIAVLWSVAAAGRLAPRRAPAGAAVGQAPAARAAGDRELVTG